tara:strand:+ start:158 stop:1087 length:930 start_codon:yes stop_codon:yes gene_type:complete
MLNNNILEYNNKILSGERKKQKISLESIASSLTLSVDQVKSLENNLDYGFITAHFRIIAIKRYAKLLEIDLNKIIIPDNEFEPEKKLLAAGSKNVLFMNFRINNIKRLLCLLLYNLKSIKKTILISLILIVVIIYLIILRDPHLSNKSSITEINTSSSEASMEVFIDDASLPPLDDDFMQIKKPKVLPRHNNITSESDSTSSESIEFLCTIKSAPMDKIWSRSKPEKPATYFHIVSKNKQSICTIDNRGIQKQYDLDAGTKITHRGEAPFKIQLDPSISDLYFQGWKVILKKTDTFVQLNPVEMTLQSN